MESTQELEILRSRTVGDQIGFTFTFLREHFRELSKCVLFIAGPGILIASAISVYLSLDIAGGRSFSSGAFMLLIVIMTIVASLLTTVVTEYVVLYAERGEGAFGFNDVWEETRRDVGKVTVTTLIVGACVGIASFFFLLPAIYLLVLTSIIIAVRVNERIGLGEAFSRSNELMKGQWWSTLGLICLIGLIYLILRLVFSIPLGILMLAGELGPGGMAGSGGFSWLKVVCSIFASVGSFLVGALPALALALHYFNLVEKYEAPGLMARIERIGEPENQESMNAGTL